VDRRALRAGRLGLAATAASIGGTIAVAAAGPSVMEPGLPGTAGQPPWSAGLGLPEYLAVALAAAALAAGTVGLGLCLYAARRGWAVRPWVLLAAGIIAATALALLPPFGSSDHLSYAAYGRMVATGHDPYTTTPAMLARLGDPVARAVQDWRHSPSVYGSLATGGQALASAIGGQSVRLTVFALSVLNLVTFAGAGLLLHLLTRGRRDRQLRAALLWTCNPLLLQVLVAGGHVDSQAVAFTVAAIALFCLGMQNAGAAASPLRRSGAAAAAGVAVGLAFAVKLSMVLVAAGLLVAAALLWWPRDGVAGRGPAARYWLAASGLAAGFAATAAAAFAPWGLRSLSPALRAGSFVSIGSPWRAVRAALSFPVGEQTADDLVKAGAIVLAIALAGLFARPLIDLARRPLTDLMERREPDPAVVAAASVLAVGFAWLAAWPYVLPWYDGLAWAPLALLPWLPFPWAVLDWLVLARTAALAFGYLPARGIVMPAGLDWLRSVVRMGVTPVMLLAVTVTLAVVLWRARERQPGAAGSP